MMNGKPSESCMRRETPGTLAILDVGHGCSAVISTDDGTVVIDTGPGSALLEYLAESGVEVIHTVVLSHADQDHVGAMAQLLASRRFRIGRVVLNTDSEKDTVIWEGLLVSLQEAANAGDIEFEVGISASNASKLDLAAVKMDVVSPTPYLAARGPGSKDQRGRSITTNTVSAVILIKCEGRPIALLGGDLDDIGLSHLLETGADIRAPILVFPHHGGKGGRATSARAEDFARRLCDAVLPSTVIFSIGRGRYATPNPQIVNGVLEECPDCWIACTQLSESCADQLPNSHPTHIGHAFSRGREHGKCCAGTFVISLQDPSIIQPSRQDHSSFVDSCAPTALCRVSRRYARATGIDNGRRGGE
ncbi:MAG: MBL fold metallo-hydrolase [Armatimonadetes bacterium]|nr:MBL fold metallo-hydrolase [Armatimonadota bacterium]